MSNNLFSHMAIEGEGADGVSAPRSTLEDNNANTAPPVAEEPQRKATDDITQEQLMSIIALDVRGVDDTVVARCIGIDEWLVRQVRQLDEYKQQMSVQATAQASEDISVDKKWDQLEDMSLDVLLSDIRSNGHSMDTVQLLTMARQANAASRRTGAAANAKSLPFGSSAGGIIDASNSHGTVVNLSFPTVLVNHLQQVVNGGQKIQSEEELTLKYADHTNSKLNMKSVGELLDVDLTKQTNDRQRPDELYMHSIELRSGDSGLVSEEAG